MTWKPFRVENAGVAVVRCGDKSLESCCRVEKDLAIAAESISVFLAVDVHTGHLEIEYNV